MEVLSLVLVIVSLASASNRIFYPEENDVNYKRFQMLISPFGDKETVDLLDDITKFASVEDLTYYFYSKYNEDEPHQIKKNDLRSLRLSPHFDSSKRTFVIVHGWVDDYTADVNSLVRRALLNNFDANIIILDWSPIASQSYTTASSAVTTVGTYLGNFINDMIDSFGVSGSQFTLIGHSLGAHIVGNAGSVTKSPVAQIIGLDPAAPLFSLENKSNRLDSSDAQYVQVIHTNGRFLGFSSSIGHADFYPNGGDIQAGCGIDLLGGCSHARAFQYLAEAIDGGQFIGTLCGSYSDYKNNRCAQNQKARMGLVDVDSSAVGDFFFDTNSDAPFAQG